MILIATLVKKKQYGKDNTKQKNMLIFTAFLQSEWKNNWIYNFASKSKKKDKTKNKPKKRIFINVKA